MVITDARHAPHVTSDLSPRNQHFNTIIVSTCEQSWGIGPPELDAPHWHAIRRDARSHFDVASCLSLDVAAVEHEKEVESSAMACNDYAGANKPTAEKS